MHRSAWLVASACSLVLGACLAPERPRRPPNVVLVISDDQAWTDFGFMGHPVIRTPNLDHLAARSAVFARGYVPSSLCRPSLATMITGLYPHQHRITGNDPPRGVARDAMLEHIAAVVTLPQLLGAQGYRSLQTGKWWEGNCRCGGFTEGMTHGDPARGGRHGDDGLRIGRQTMQPIVDFVAACGDEPFFLWYAPLLPHTPHDPPERLLAHYRAPGRSDHVARYYAMCEWFDETCGQLFDCLAARGLSDDTIVLFAVDNGWIQREDAGGFAARSKRSPYDAGVRTPILVSWPGRVPPGPVDSLASTVDLATTILSSCGVPAPANLPGRDLIAIARGEAPKRDTAFGAIFEHDVVDVGDPSASLRSRWIVRGDHKLIVPTAADRPAELYAITADPAEQVDLAGAQPEQAADLRAVLDAWWSGTGPMRR